MLRFGFKRPFKSFTTHPSLAEGVVHKIVLPRWYHRVDLGDHSYMNDECEVHCFTRPHTLRVGRYSSVGQCKFVIDGDHDTALASTYPFREFGMCDGAPRSTGGGRRGSPVVGNDAWICDGAVLIGGVSVGDGAVVAGHAVVTKDVPPYAVVAGNPARVVKSRFAPDVVADLLEVEWWDLDHDAVCRELAPVLGDVAEFVRRARAIRAIRAEIKAGRR